MSSLETKSASTTLINMIAEISYSIDNVKEKILAAYDYAIEKDNFTPKEAAKLLREKLEFSDSYIRKVLPLESKQTEKSNKPPVDALLESHNSQENDKKVVNITTAYDLKDAESSTAIDQDQITQTEEEPIDDSYNYTLDEVEPPRFIQFKYNLDFKDQIIPLIVTTYIEKGTGYVEVDDKEARKLKRF